MIRPDCATHKWVPPTRTGARVPLGLLNVLKSTFAGVDSQAGTPRAPVGAAGFSLRARGLKPTALFSGASRRFVTRTYP